VVFSVCQPCQELARARAPTHPGSVVRTRVCQRHANTLTRVVPQVGRLAAMHGVHVRTGCCCNPGACAEWLGLSEEDVLRHHR
jgi:hypothetical protein